MKSEIFEMLSQVVAPTNSVEASFHVVAEKFNCWKYALCNAGINNEAQPPSVESSCFFGNASGDCPLALVGDYFFGSRGALSGIFLSCMVTAMRVHRAFTTLPTSATAPTYSFSPAKRIERSE